MKEDTSIIWNPVEPLVDEPHEGISNVCNFINYTVKPIAAYNSDLASRQCTMILEKFQETIL
jgi:hypothetical protein